MKARKKLDSGVTFVGREAQLTELREVLNSNQPEFVAVYGRRRVGKTLIIRKAAENKFTFYYTAAANISKKEQLANFALVLQSYDPNSTSLRFNNWFEAFKALGDYIDSLPTDRNKIIFIDEMPWADSPKSGFLPAFENFWNVRCAFRSDIKIVVCGSATSWILNKIIHNIGGLYGRLTHIFKIEPFNLNETQKYFKAHGFRYSQRQLAEIYMILGGIPYYFSLFVKGESVAQNIDRLFFGQNAQLKKEFEVLYSSLYRNPLPYIDVIQALSRKGKGLTRQELIEILKVKSNGAFTKVLKELEEGGFIRAYYPFESNRKTKYQTRNNIIYQLIDLYSLFYLRFVKESDYKSENFWSSNYNTPRINSWRGYSFETLSLWHVPKIKAALGISGINTQICAWMGTDSEGEKAQIDMLIDRSDGVVNICEMKWSADLYAITRNYALDLQKKLEVFYEVTKVRKVTVMTLIVTKGVKLNAYRDFVQQVVTLDQLFK